MTPDVEDWLRCSGIQFLRKIGIAAGNRVLDFGCSVGHYSIPASQVVGAGGIIFALDKEIDVLLTMLDVAKSFGLQNIVAILTRGELTLVLDNSTLDAVLLYDVVHSHYFSGPHDRKELFLEVQRVLKADGLLSIFPKHIDVDIIKKEGEELGFHCVEKQSYNILHRDDLEENYILNFRVRK